MKPLSYHASAFGASRFRAALFILVIFLGPAPGLFCSSTQQTGVFPLNGNIRPLPPSISVTVIDCYPGTIINYERENEILIQHMKQGYYFVARGAFYFSTTSGALPSHSYLMAEARSSGGNLIICLGDISSKDKKTEYTPYDVDKNWQVQFKKREYITTTNLRSYLLLRTDRGVPPRFHLTPAEKKKLEDWRRDYLARDAE